MTVSNGQLWPQTKWVVRCCQSALSRLFRQSNDARRATIAAKLTNHGQEDIESLVRLSSSKSTRRPCRISGCLACNFPTYSAEFAEFTTVWPPSIPELDPRYSRNPGFTFFLKPIIKNGGSDDANLSIKPNSISDNGEIIRWRLILHVVWFSGMTEGEVIL